MAQYHFHASILKRSDGRSAIASAAYQAGERIYDTRLGEAFDYRRRSGVLYTEILTPENAPDWMRDRYELWNGVEKSEKRKDSQLARSIDISLMCELSFEKNLELIRTFVKEKWVDKGMLADMAIHAPGYDSDDRNIHVHILLTMRDIRPDGFGPKQRQWNTKYEFNEWREAWADHANRMLEREGFDERIDHRSLKDQGIDREPTIHIGPAGKEMDDRGDHSDRAQKNRDIEAVNDNLELLKNQLTESEKRLAELRQQLAAERMEQIQDTVSAADEIWKKSEARWPPTPEQEPPTPARQVQPQGAPAHPPDSAPASPGGKAASMPDNVSELSEQQKRAGEQEAVRQKQAQDSEQARQKQAADDQEKTTEALKQQEKHSQEQKQEQDRLQQLRDAENKKVEDAAKQNADRIAAQAEQMRLAQQRLDAEQAKIAAFHAEQNRIAQEDKRRQEAERQARLEEQAKEGPIRNASYRYGQALGQNYDIRDPYASLAKSAMAEYAAFSRDREAYDRQIAKAADPLERQALDLRKRIEGADYLALTGDRIAVMSEIITGRRNSQEAIKERQKATDWRIKAQDLRQQLRDLQREPAPDKDRVRERTPDKDTEPERAPAQPRPAEASRPPSRSTSRSQDDELIKKQDELQKQKDRLEMEKAPERQNQQERERELQRKRDRER